MFAQEGTGFTKCRTKQACFTTPRPPCLPTLRIGCLLQRPLSAPSESGQSCRCSHFYQLKTAIEEGSVGVYGCRSISCAESQAAPESKGAALGQWQHGSGEATSMLARRPCCGLVSFTGTGCHVDSEPRFSPIV